MTRLATTLDVGSEQNKNFEWWITRLVYRGRAKQTLWFIVNCRTLWSSTSWTHIAAIGYTVAPFVWGSVDTSIVTFVSGGLWGVMVLMSCVENCVWCLIKVSLFTDSEYAINRVWTGWVVSTHICEIAFTSVAKAICAVEYGSWACSIARERSSVVLRC